ncbi:BC1872 family protein [Paenibacillus sp. FSL L8-0708]|uniref:BC1872 family protein n=1 Tax=Paenibacillus sp. FSL L8-0708 TaxID=2975311 RepID=UPI0030F58044
MTLTREEILAMDPIELGPVVAEHVFKAKVIGKENFPELSLLIGWFGYEAWKPMKGTWHNAEWRNSEEKAWLDCPRFGEDISEAWEVEERIKVLRLHTGYVSCIKQVLVGTGEYVGMFDYIHATAEQRCKAALLAVLNL